MIAWVVVPGLLGVAWVVLWAVRRRVPAWFFAAAAGLALLCFPAGVVASHIELSGVSNCTADNLCFSIYEVDLWGNGLLGMLTTAVLAVVTGVIALTRRLASPRRE